MRVGSGQSRSAHVGGDAGDISVAAAAAPSLPSLADVPGLPDHQPLSSASFSWGNHAGESVATTLESIYYEVVHWRPNLFSVPLGQAGKRFVEETSRLALAYAESSALESVALLAMMIRPALLLQKANPGATHRDRVACLGRRIDLWSSGQFDELLREGRVIQQRLLRQADHRAQRTGRTDDEHLSRTFSKLMLVGKVKSALRLLSQPGRGRLLSLDDAVISGGKEMTAREVLLAKHPPAAPADPAALLTDTPPLSHPVLFDRLDGAMIRSSALHSQGSAGPSGLDASNWRRLCTMYHGSSQRLCNAIAAVGRRLATTYLHPDGLRALTACRLIPLDKNPGVRPIGVCEALRRIIGKAILRVAGPDIRWAVGSLQLCAGQKAGSEAAVHAMQDLFACGAEGILLVDAQNAFNSLNRRVALHNIQSLCPSLAPTVINYYRSAAHLFVGGECIFSMEGTTQGDPLSMAIYALSTIPLIRRVAQDAVTQVWFADDAGAGGVLRALFTWWQALVATGPMFGYYVNPDKTWLLVKDELAAEAHALFAKSGIKITTEGRPHLGSPLGSSCYSADYAKSQVAEWVSEIQVLATIAAPHPHAAYAAYTHGLASKWTYLSRALSGMADFLQPVEDIVRNTLLPAITGRVSVGDIERDLLGLPARLGGLALPNPVEVAPLNHDDSRRVTRPLVSAIAQQELGSGPDDTVTALQQEASAEVRRARAERHRQRAAAVYEQLPPRTQRAMVLAQEKGSSTWLTTLPLDDYGFALTKSDFRDALCLRYGWEPARLPAICACGQRFDVEHALSCPRGGFVASRHNEIRDVLGDLLSDVCKDVSVEPPLQPLSGELFRSRAANTEDGARLDIKAGGFWGSSRHVAAFFDVRVFNPHAASYAAAPLPRTYRRHEAQKRAEYEERVREVERGSFTPLVFSCLGGAGPAATVFLRRLAALLAEKKNTTYTLTLGWLRCRLTFALLRSSILCLRGARAAPVPGRPSLCAPDLAVVEGRVSYR